MYNTRTYMYIYIYHHKYVLLAGLHCVYCQLLIFTLSSLIQDSPRPLGVLDGSQVAVFNKGSTVIAGGDDLRNTYLYSVQTQQKIATFQAHLSSADVHGEHFFRSHRPCFSPEEDLILSNGNVYLLLRSSITNMVW